MAARVCVWTRTGENWIIVVMIRKGGVNEHAP